MTKWFLWIVAVIFGGWAFSLRAAPSEKQFATREFGRLPILSNGRVQPIDSLARNSLLQIREKQAANLEPWKNWWEKPKLISATEWAMLVMMKPAEADTWPVFRVDNPDLKSLLAVPLEPDAAKHTDGKHYSWNQIEPKLEDVRREAVRANGIESSLRSPYDQALLRLWNARTIYLRLKNALGPAASGDLQAGLAEYNRKIDAGRRALDAQMRGNANFDRGALAWLSEQLDAPIIVPGPTPAGGKRTDGWQRVIEAIFRTQSGNEPMPEAVADYARMANAFRSGDAAAFNAATKDYQNWLAKDYQPELSKASNELRFNFAQPFYRALVLYVMAFMVVLAYWAFPSCNWLRLCAVACALVALVIHSGGLVARMMLEGRPPVTNRNSSAVFIGWGACVLGLLLEKFWRNSIGVLVSATVGFITLIIAHHLSTSGDTMEMMRAVLDTNFWLATHVVVVTLGYASTFVPQEGGPITDDHVPLQAAGLRVIDVIDYTWTLSDGRNYHHTTMDTMDKLSERSLQIVGDVAMKLLRQE